MYNMLLELLFSKIYASRITNHIAHWLVNYSFDSNVRLKWFEQVSYFILDVFIYDCNRIWLNKIYSFLQKKIILVAICI